LHEVVTQQFSDCLTLRFGMFNCEQPTGFEQSGRSVDKSLRKFKSVTATEKRNCWFEVGDIFGQWL
jgi:hypothetical protein